MAVTSPPAKSMSSPAHVVHSPLSLSPLQSHHPRPTAVALMLVVNGPPLSSLLQSHHPRPNQRCPRLTSFTAPPHHCHHGHIIPSPPPSRSRCSWPPAVIVVAVTSPPAHRHHAHIVHGLSLSPSRSHDPQPTAVALMFASALSSSLAYCCCAEIVPAPAAITLR
jgi:hypothetical protein